MQPRLPSSRPSCPPYSSVEDPAVSSHLHAPEKAAYFPTVSSSLSPFLPVHRMVLCESYFYHHSSRAVLPPWLSSLPHHLRSNTCCLDIPFRLAAHRLPARPSFTLTLASRRASNLISLEFILLVIDNSLLRPIFKHAPLWLRLFGGFQIHRILSTPFKEVSNEVYLPISSPLPSALPLPFSSPGPLSRFTTCLHVSMHSSRYVF